MTDTNNFIAAAKALVSALDACDPHITAAFQMAFVRMGATYNGPTYAAELRALREALERLEKTDDA